MKHSICKLTTTILGVLIIFSSCKKEKENPSVNSRAVKYEITGNYSGQLLVVYNDNVSGNTVITVTTLPWSKEVTYTDNVKGIGIAGHSIIGHLGLPSQSASLKIYSEGALVKSQSASTDTDGSINLPSISYVFQ